MTSIIKLHPFSGVEGEGPPCYMLQVDEFNFLLDCGWDEGFSMTAIENVKKSIPQIDAVLLSYPDPYHIGALPYLVGKCGLSCAIYATIPVYKMGQMFMYDLYQSRHNNEEFDIFTLDDVDSAFDKIVQLKYSQTVNLRGKGHGLQVTPLPAGHMIGGTIWKIVKDGEEEIVYAIDYNHKKERHLNGCVLDTIQRPYVLITDAFNADYTQARRRQRDEELMTSILQTLRNNGNVLIAIDTAGRVLELSQLLDQLWRSQGSGLMAYSLAMLNNVSYNVVEFAKSQVEWMSDKIMRSFEDQRNNPFQFRQIQLCHSLAELSRVPDPKVVLASTPDMECGFSKDLFVQWCGSPNNCIILTSRTAPGTLARSLIDNPNMKTIKLEVKRRVKLEGAELEEHMRKEREKETDDARKKAELARKDMESSDESDEEMDLELGHMSSKTKHDLMSKSQGKHRAGFFKQAKKSYPMFPVVEEKLKWDDYGELIRPEDYLILEAAPTEDDNKENAMGDESTMNEVAEVPTKCIKSVQNLDVEAKILFIDFEGRSDGESIKKILQHIKPRQLMLVHGTDKATQLLAAYAKNTRDLVQGRVLVPKLGETTDATKESHIYQVRLRDAIVSALKFYRARDAELAWIDAELNISMSRTDTSVKGPGEHGDHEDMDSEAGPGTVPTLLPLLPHKAPGHSAVFVNEPRLSDFKQVLIKEGMQAEFSGGILICNNLVAVRRNEAGKMQLEGALGEDYYKVRDLLYQQYAIV